MFTDLANSVSRFFYQQSAGMFILRLATGAIFVAHGVMKLEDPAMVAGFFAKLGLLPGLQWVWFIALLEVIGGAALILGLATRFFGSLLAIEMLVAILLTGIGRGFHAHELELILAAASLSIALAGSGRWSLYKMECAKCGGIFCDGDTCAIVAPE
ncbi:MAG TPA: DoxX family protein [Candidatus Paceibacterota bacterium]|nr:DoxX family protein [Candidatus Paceibacterota bacterium]